MTVKEALDLVREFSPLIISLLTAVSSALAVLLRISEKLALDPTTKANGIVHGYQLARADLAIEQTEAGVDKTKEALAGAEELAEELAPLAGGGPQLGKIQGEKPPARD